MRAQESLPWIVRCSMRLYRWLLCLGPESYRRQYGDLTFQLFRACCWDAYRRWGTHGVLSLWLPLFSDLVAQMVAEQFSELQRATRLTVSVETVSSCISERRSSMDRWQQLNRRGIRFFGSLTRLRRRLMWPLKQRRIEADRRTAPQRFAAELQSLLNYPANMHFEEGLQHWGPIHPPKAFKPGFVKSGVVTSDLPGGFSAFLLSTVAPTVGVLTLRQKIKADDYRGKQLRFSGEVKAEQLSRPGALYISTDVIRL